MFSKAEFYTFIYGTRIDNAKAPPFLKFRSSKSFIVCTIALAVFTDIFLYSVVVPVLPFALTGRAGISENEVQRWTSIFLSVYGAALAVGSPLFGWFADRTTSRRVPLLLGLLALGGSTGMLCAGNSLGLLLAGRLMQGFSAAVVWTVGLALLSDTIPKDSIGVAMGYVAGATSIGSLLGPLLGGVVYAGAGYYAVFAMGFALIGLDVLLRLLLIEKKVAEQWLPAEPETPPTTRPTTGGLSDASVVSEIESKSVPDQFVPSGPSPTSEAEKTRIEMEQETPAKSQKWIHRLPPLITLLRIPRILVALFGCLVISTSLTAFDSVLPLYVKNTFGWTSTGAGLIFICLVVPALFSPSVGFFHDKYGGRVITTTGLLGAVPFWVLLRLVTYNSIGQKVLLCALLVILGFFMTLVMTPLLAEIDHAVVLEEKKNPEAMGKRGAAAQGFGLFNFAYALGSLIGPLWAGFTVQDAGWGTMGWSLGVLSGVCAITTFIWTGGRIMLKGKERRDASAEEGAVV